MCKIYRHLSSVVITKTVEDILNDLMENIFQDIDKVS